MPVACGSNRVVIIVAFALALRTRRCGRAEPLLVLPGLCLDKFSGDKKFAYSLAHCSSTFEFVAYATSYSLRSYKDTNIHMSTHILILGHTSKYELFLNT